MAPTVTVTRAVIVSPGATGFLMAKQFARMLIVAVVSALVCTFAGIYISFFADASPAVITRARELFGDLVK